MKDISVARIFCVVMATLLFSLMLIPAGSAAIGVKAGDWIKYDYTVTGWPAGTPYAEWLKIEFLSVEGTTATVRVTMRMSNGTELSDTMPVDLAAGGGVFGGLYGFVIPVNSKVGDPIDLGGYGYTIATITIDGEKTRSYAGASRTVVYSSFSLYGSELTYYWDKETGVMVEASTTGYGITGTAKATETNMWEAGPLSGQGLWILVIVIIIVVVVVGGSAVLLLRRRKAPLPEVTPTPTEQSKSEI